MMLPIARRQTVAAAVAALLGLSVAAPARAAQTKDRYGTTPIFAGEGNSYVFLRVDP